MRLNHEEAILGGLSVAILVLKLGWFILILSPLCAILWSMGGRSGSSKLFRRLGVPLSASTFITIALGFSWLRLLTIPLGFGILCLGDGYPDPLTQDRGSWLGSRIYQLNIFSDNLGGRLTKLAVPLIFQIALVPLFL